VRRRDSRFSGLEGSCGIARSYGPSRRRVVGRRSRPSPNEATLLRARPVVSVVIRGRRRRRGRGRGSVPETNLAFPDLPILSVCGPRDGRRSHSPYESVWVMRGIWWGRRRLSSGGRWTPDDYFDLRMGAARRQGIHSLALRACKTHQVWTRRPAMDSPRRTISGSNPGPRTSRRRTKPTSPFAGLKPFVEGTLCPRVARKKGGDLSCRTTRTDVGCDGHVLVAMSGRADGEVSGPGRGAWPRRRGHGTRLMPSPVFVCLRGEPVPRTSRRRTKPTTTRVGLKIFPGRNLERRGWAEMPGRLRGNGCPISGAGRASLPGPHEGLIFPSCRLCDPGNSGTLALSGRA
jgi:hypothetical protein